MWQAVVSSGAWGEIVAELWVHVLQDGELQWESYRKSDVFSCNQDFLGWLIFGGDVIQGRNKVGCSAPRAMGLQVEVVGGPLLPLETPGFISTNVPVPPAESCSLFLFNWSRLQTCISLFPTAKRSAIPAAACWRRLKALKVLLIIFLGSSEELYISNVIKKYGVWSHYFK